MATRTAPDLNELIEVVWADTQAMVKLPRHLMSGASKAAQERHLIATGQLIDPNAPAMPEMQEPQQIIQSVVDAAALAGVERRLAALEGKPDPILPSEQALATWSQQAARVGLAHAEMAALADATVATCESVGNTAQARLDGLDAQQQELIATVSGAVSEMQEGGALAVASMQQQGAEALSVIEADATAVAKRVAREQAQVTATEVANRHWGSSLTFCTEDPSKTDHASFAKRWYGRDFLIEGDGCGQTTDSGLIIWRFAGGNWRKSSELVEKTALVNQQLAISDRSTQVITSFVQSGGSGGGGGGGEHLLTNRIGVGGSIAVADSSNWAGISDVTAGQLLIELTALDGGLVGRTYFVLIPFSWDPSGNEFTVDGELGGLKGLYDINVTVQRSAAVAPGVYSGALPVGANRTVVFLSVVPSPGGGGDTTSFRLAGDVEWAHVAQGNAAQTGRQPLWVWA